MIRCAFGFHRYRPTFRVAADGWYSSPPIIRYIDTCRRCGKPRPTRTLEP